jgi:hypothetical protein
MTLEEMFHTTGTQERQIPAVSVTGITRSHVTTTSRGRTDYADFGIATTCERSHTAVQLWAREERGWTLSTFGEGETVPLEAVSATLNVDGVYAAARNA